MSSLIVEVCDVREVKQHGNADSLEKIIIKGWEVIVQKSLNLKVGDPVVYFPPDSVMSEELADKLGIKKYLAPVKHDDPTKYRVKATRLRGEPSYGTIDHVVPKNYKVGDDVTDYFGITKYEPPLPPLRGNQEKDRVNRDHPFFYKYNGIENIRNFPDLIEDGEEVVYVEKLHGMNGRSGLILDKNEEGYPEFVYMSGSNNVQRKEFDNKGNQSEFWLPLNDPHFCILLHHLCQNTNNVIVYWELIGSKIQDMEYGHAPGEVSYRAFDIRVNGKFLDVDTKTELFELYNIPACPVLYRGPFSWESVNHYTYGDTTICDVSQAGKFKGREGIVITPVKERKGGRHNQRVILKSVSADYLARKGGTEYH